TCRDRARQSLLHRADVEYGLIVIQCCNLIPDCSSQTQRFDTRTHQHVYSSHVSWQRRNRNLIEVEIKLGRVCCLSFETRVLDVSDHADDFMTLSARHVQLQASSEWI